jgi:UDP-3-O-[3-hydroxymyristoyl] N-acetylglucosamine deacetylase
MPASSIRMGLRFGDEFVRHKILDAVGDLSLAGAPLRGVYRAFCPGHAVNFAMLEALFSDRANYALKDERDAVRAGASAPLSAALAPERG